MNNSHGPPHSPDVELSFLCALVENETTAHIGFELADDPLYIPAHQDLYRLLTPQDPNINLNGDGAIDFKDYSLLADTWLDELLWP